MKLNATEVKRQNKRMIFQYLLERDDRTKPEIAVSLGLSTPTVGQIISELQQAGLVIETGMQTSNGGRKAVTLRVNEGAHYAMGIDVTKNHVGVAIVNLKGEIVECIRMRKPFRLEASYCSEVYRYALDFLEKHQLDMDSVLGIGVALPGIVDAQQKWLYYSRPLDIRDRIEMVVPEYVSVPMRFFCDPTAACLAEMHRTSTPDTFTYISLSNTVGGTFVCGRKIIEGNTGRNGRCGEVGHICIEPNGRPCYCGKMGHYDSYGSALVLANHADGNLEMFFQRLNAGDPKLKKIFEVYLDHLAFFLYNLEIASNHPIILGGYVGCYLEPYLPELRRKMKEQYIFELDDDYVSLCHYKNEAAAVGSALHFVEQFVQSV